MLKKNTFYFNNALALIVFISFLIIFNFHSYAFNPNADDMSLFYQDEETGIWIHADCNQSSIDGYTKAYLDTPAIVRAMLKQADINIYIVPYDMPEPENQSISASYWPTLYETNHYGDAVTNIMRKGWIVCYGNLPTRYFNAQQLIFAMGKAIDNYTSYMDGHATSSLYAISDSDGWKNIYNHNNAKNLKDVWHMDELSELNWPLNSSTGFADAFRMYVVKPEKLKEASNEVYEFIDNQMTVLTSYYHTKYGAIPDSEDTMPTPHEPLAKAVNQDLNVQQEVVSDIDNTQPETANEILKKTEAKTETKDDTRETGDLTQDTASIEEYKTETDEITPEQIEDGHEEITQTPASKDKITKTSVKQDNGKIKYIAIGIMITIAILAFIGLCVYLIRRRQENQRDLKENFRTSFTYTWQEIYNMQLTGYKKVAGLYMITGSGVHNKQFKPSNNMFQDAMFEMRNVVQRQHINQDRVAASLKVIMYPLKSTKFKSLEEMERKFYKFTGQKTLNL